VAGEANGRLCHVGAILTRLREGFATLSLLLFSACGSRTGLPVFGEIAESDGGADATPIDAGTDAAPVPNVLFFGGETNTDQDPDDTWTWDGMSWRKHAVAGPGGRWGAAAATLHGTVVLFGGVGPDALARGDTWTWDGASWSKRDVPGPSPRSNAAIATLGNVVVLFGGLGTGRAGGPADLGDTWTWDGTSWTELEVSGPPARDSAAVAATEDELVLFGGENFGVAGLGDTWTWDGAKWTEHFVIGPTERFGASAAALGKTVVLFGGTWNNEFYDETWVWTGDNWSFMDVHGPEARQGAAAATLGETVVLFGGNNVPTPRGTWTWDGANWTVHTVPGPSDRTNPVMSGP
jgi:N-acetylneuraminic acid mutarotase